MDRMKEEVVRGILCNFTPWLNANFTIFADYPHSITRLSVTSGPFVVDNCGE